MATPPPPPSPDSAAISTPDLQALQDGLGASIQTVLAAYAACGDPGDRTTLLQHSKDLAAQMSQIETALFHQQTLQATAVAADAFKSAQGLNAQIKAMSDDAQKTSDLIAAIGKLVGVVAGIVSLL